ncbi:MAG TPA: cytochrome c [Thermomicrobiales bacterium]|nr:cytochrome c [Thermomicrobiales bacterium]
MAIFSQTHRRLMALIAVVALTLVASVPLMGAARQDEASPVTSDLVAQGEVIFNNVCIACHQPDGKGIQGIYLPLAGNPLVTLEDPTYLITTILNGRGGMPRFDTTYSDEQIAAIASFVRQAWENDAPAVSAEEVAAVRANYVAPAVVTPEGQIPEGSGRATPAMVASPVASPGATPAG